MQLTNGFIKDTSKNEILAWIKDLANDLIVSGYSYGKIFEVEWSNICKLADEKVRWIPPITDLSQTLKYDYVVNGNRVISFFFSIDYFLCKLKHLHAIELENSDSILKLNGFVCKYSMPPIGEIRPITSYKNATDIITIPFLQSDSQFLIVDGNHRVASQILDNKKMISAKVADLQLSVLSLQSPLQVYSYLLNDSYWFIKHNLSTVSHKKLYMHLMMRNYKIIAAVNNRTLKRIAIK